MIQKSFEVVLAEDGKTIGYVRHVLRGELIVHNGSAGDFVVPGIAIKEERDRKVVVYCDGLEPRIRARFCRGHNHR